MSFSSFNSTLKLKTHSQLTQSLFMGTDCLFFVFKALAASGHSHASKQQKRNLSIHEYQAMDLLRDRGISVPIYKVAEEPNEVHAIAEEFGMFMYELRPW